MAEEKYKFLRLPKRRKLPYWNKGLWALRKETDTEYFKRIKTEQDASRKR